MNKFFASALVLTALSGVAAAGEREHDLRLADPSYGETVVDGNAVPNQFLNQFKVRQSATKSAYFLDEQRRDEKNGTRG